jgi:hypothetical protein
MTVGPERFVDVSGTVDPLTARCAKGTQVDPSEGRTDQGVELPAGVPCLAVTSVDPAPPPAVRTSPELLKWKPALVAQFVSDGRTATMPASDDTDVTVPTFQVPDCAA